MTKRLTAAEAAKQLGISATRVVQLIHLGKLTGVSEPWGPTTRWMVDEASVEKRKKQAKKGFPVGGRPKKESL